MSLISKRIFLLILLMCVKTFLVTGYSATIKGNVSDKQNSEPLAGAIVMLTGTTYGATTGLDGSYIIRNIPKGEYDLEVKYFSFETFKKHISVTDVEVIIINCQLSQLSKTLNEVQVTAKYNNGTDEQARNMEKNSNNLLNILSARTIELLPDITVANLLQRVSGVQVERDANGEAKYATIRGMDKRYNYTTVNGVKIASPDDKARFVPLDIFPAEILDRVEVIKSLTPDMEGDAVGGVTNLVMKKAPDHLVVYATAATGYNQNLFDEHYNSFDKGAIVAKDPTALHGVKYVAAVTDFPLGSSVIKSIQAPPNDLFSLSLGNRFLKDKKLGVMFSGSYQNTFKETNNLFFKPASQPDVNNVPEFDDLDLRKYSTQETRIGLHTNIDYHINDKNTISLYGLFLQLNQLEERNVIDTVITAVNRPGPGLGNVDFQDRTTLTKQNIQNLQLKGEHVVANGLKADWTGAISKATSDVPDRTEFTTTNTFSKDTSGKIKQAGATFKSSTKSWERTTDQDMQGFLNITYTPAVLDEKVEFKGGGMYRSKDRDNYYNEYKIDPKSAHAGVGVPYTNVQSLNDTTLKLGTSPTGIAHQNDLTYHVHENIWAYYVQAKLHLLDNKLEVLGGVRIENTHVSDSVELDPKVRDAVAGVFDYMDVLPSLHLKYKLSNKENLRLSYFESISRPGFYEVVTHTAPGEDFDEIGNPHLNHSVAQNLDARYEWFPKGIDQVLIGGFYKNIDNPIEYLLVRPGGPSLQQIQPNNIPNTVNYGSELVVTKYFHYFGVSANYTYTHSSVNVSKDLVGLDSLKHQKIYTVSDTRPLQGQAAHVGNLALIYKNPKSGFDAHLSLQYTGRHIALLSEWAGLNYWQKGTTFFDFSCEKRIVKHLFTYAKVNNLLNTPTIVELTYSSARFTDAGKPAFYLPYQNLADKNILVERNLYGRNYLVGIRYKLD